MCVYLRRNDKRGLVQWLFGPRVIAFDARKGERRIQRGFQLKLAGRFLRLFHVDHLERDIIGSGINCFFFLLY